MAAMPQNIFVTWLNEGNRNQGGDGMYVLTTSSTDEGKWEQVRMVR